MTTATNEKTGLPIIEDGDKAFSKDIIGSVIKEIVFLGVGYGIGYAIWAWGSNDVYQTRINNAKAYDLQWLLLGLIIFQLANTWMNAFTMSKKAAIMDWNQPKLRPNMGIYKLATVPEDEGSAVVLMTEGDAGRYNRANRATYHFLENSIAFVFSQYAAFYIFPFPAFVLLCAFSFGRIAY